MIFDRGEAPFTKHGGSVRAIWAGLPFFGGVWSKRPSVFYFLFEACQGFRNRINFIATSTSVLFSLKLRDWLNRREGGSRRTIGTYGSIYFRSMDSIRIELIRKD